MNDTSSGNPPHRLLIIDDNIEITDILTEVGRDAGYDVRSINDFTEIKPAYREFSPDLIFLDLDLSVDLDVDMSERGYDGLAVFNFLAENNCQSRIVLISGMGKGISDKTKSIGKEMKLNVIGSIPKPFSVEVIRKLLLKLKGEN